MCRAVARWRLCCEAEERPIAVAGQILDGREEAHSQPFLQAGPPEHRFDALASWAGKNIFLRHFEEKIPSPGDQSQSSGATNRGGSQSTTEFEF